MPKTLLLTRPKEDSDALAQLLRAKDFACICEPMLSVSPHKSSISLSPPPSAIILSSRHAAHAVSAHPQWLSAEFFAVGEMTAQALRDIGATRVTTAPTMEALAPQVTANSVLYLRGADVSHDLRTLLPKANLMQIVAYSARPTTRWSEDFLKSLHAQPLDGALFFSRRTAEAFVNLARALPKDAWKHTTAFALSDHVRDALSDLSWKEIIVSAQPTQSSLLEAVDNHLS